jgi:hypothetical protein
MRVEPLKPPPANFCLITNISQKRSLWQYSSATFVYNLNTAFMSNACFKKWASPMFSRMKHGVLHPIQCTTPPGPQGTLWVASSITATVSLSWYITVYDKNVFTIQIFSPSLVTILTQTLEVQTKCKDILKNHKMFSNPPGQLSKTQTEFHFQIPKILTVQSTPLFTTYMYC